MPLLHKYKKLFKSKFRASNTLLDRAEYAITRTEHFSSLPKHLATVAYFSLQQKQFALQLRGPGQAPLCLSLSYFSLVAPMDEGVLFCKVC